MARIYLAYFVSGFVSLAYQIVWYRCFVDRIGASNITFVLVLCCFIGGLGAGSAASRRAAARLRPLLGGRDNLTFYGQIELIITVTALGLFVFSSLPNHIVSGFPYVLKGNVYEPTWIYQTLKVLAVVLCVFIPCFFMGITFPLLCAVFKRHERFPSRLYAWNTFGACAGVVVCEFVLIRYLGTTVAFCAALLLNALLGAWFLKQGERLFGLLVGQAAAPSESDSVDDSTEPEPAEKEANPSDTAPPPISLRTAAACAAVSGLLSGGLEADMLKRYALWGEHLKISFSFLIFWAIFAIFLASLCIRKPRAWRFPIIQVLFIAAFVYHLTAAYYHIPLRMWSNRFVLTYLTHDAYSVGLAESFMMNFFAIFPTYFCIALLLPHVCNRCQERRRHLGAVYGLNTIAFCAGVLVFGWIAPLVNPFYSVRAFVGVFAVAVVVLLTLSETRPPRRLLWAPAAVALALVFILSSRGVDRGFFRGREVETLPISHMRSDSAHVVFIAQEPGYRTEYFDCHPMSANNPRALQYMKLMAHFPLLAHTGPKTALLICFGVGNTAKAIADHSSIERLDAVDLCGPVFELAPQFADTNNRVYEDKRVRLIHDDGRNFLNLTAGTYDLITSEPPPPCHPGVGRLYSLEYYQACKRRLSPNGLVSQWLPIYQMTSEMLDRSVATFRLVFPYTMMFVGAEEDIIIVGSPEPIDFSRVETRFACDKRVLADLESVGVKSVTQLLARVVQVDDTIDERFKGKGILTDENNFLDYAVTTQFVWYQIVGGRKMLTGPFVQERAALGYHSLPVLKELKRQDLRCYEQLRAILESPESLKKIVPDFPIYLPAPPAAKPKAEGQGNRKAHEGKEKRDADLR
ncbi:MAG: hypothetical protein AB1696_03140 [Planctomycetota bacterium]